MSAETEWESAVPIASKPDPQSEWDDAKPVKLPKAAAPKPKAEPSGIREGPMTALTEGALNMGSSMLAKPVSDIAGLAATGKEMISPTPGGGDPAGFKRSIQEGMTYDPKTRGGAAVAQYNPMALLAKLFGWGGEKAKQLAAPPGESGPVRSAIGSGIEEAVPQLANLAGARYGKPVSESAAAAGKDVGRGVMQSALKPPVEAQRTGKADAAIETLLQEGVNVSRGGADKLRGRIDALDDRISQIIQNSPATIDKQHVAYRLQETLDKFKQQVNPLTDIRAIQKAWDEFLDHPLLQGKGMSVKEAQDMKRGTYKALGDKAYGELKGAEIEAQKTLARGLKEEIARAVPEVRPLNAEQSKLLNALPLVERRALMEANKNPAGLGWLTTNPGQFAAWMADRSGAFKSLVARMIYTGADALPPLASPGAAAIQQGQIGQGQLPPPPQ